MNLLVTGAWSFTEFQIEKIKELGNNIIFMQNESDSLPCDYSMVEGVICNGLFLHHPIEKFTSLKYIQLTSAGFDRVSIDYIKEKNIVINNAKGVYSIPMSEYALGGVLQLYKKSAQFLSKQKSHQWVKDRNLRELYGKTVLIVGCGNVGEECAKRFSAFGTDVLGVDITSFENSNFKKIYPIEKLNETLKISDIVVLTIPLTDKTKHLFNKEIFEYMKPDSVLVNISRGAVVDTEALIEALKDKLYGAVLDVFEEEPLLEKSPLWDMENVIITPHNSFIGENNGDRLFDVINENLKGFLK